MKKILTLLVASTALTVAIGGPGRSAAPVPADGGPGAGAALFEDAPRAMPLVLASGDDDDDRRWRQGSRRGEDDDCDDDDEDEDEDEDDDDDDGCRGGGRNPAPAGTAAPPQNGLFGNGAPPQVQVN